MLIKQYVIGLKDLTLIKVILSQSLNSIPRLFGMKVVKLMQSQFLQELILEKYH